MRLPASSFSLRALPAGRSLVLIAMATLLAAADWLPENRYVDPDTSEFALSLGLGLLAIFLTLREQLTAATVARWRNRALLCVMTAGIWGTLWIVNPALRTHTFVSSVGTWLSIAAFRSWRRRQSDISS